MKIIQISASYKPAAIYGGPTMSVSKLSEELYKSRIDVTVLTTLANGKAELDFPTGEMTLIDNVPVWFFKRITKDHSHFSPGLLKHLFKTIQTDQKSIIVHIHAWWNLVSVLACLFAHFKKIPVVLSPRGTLSPYSFAHKKSVIKKWMHLLAGKKLLAKCHFHVTSEQEKQEILQLVQPKSITVIPNFVQLPSDLKSQRKAKTGTLKLLFFSRIEPKKVLEILLEALNGIEINYQLTIAGSGEPDYVGSLQKIVHKRSMQPFVNWIGFQHNNTKFEVLQTHDLLVLPSYNENFGNVVIESLAVGTPVLISKNVGLADYINTNNLGWVFDNNAENLKEKLQEISSNKHLLTEISLRAPLQIKCDFAEENLVSKYKNLYKSILND